MWPYSQQSGRGMTMADWRKELPPKREGEAGSTFIWLLATLSALPSPSHGLRVVGGVSTLWVVVV